MRAAEFGQQRLGGGGNKPEGNQNPLISQKLRLVTAGKPLQESVESWDPQRPVKSIAEKESAQSAGPRPMQPPDLSLTDGKLNQRCYAIKPEFSLDFGTR